MTWFSLEHSPAAYWLDFVLYGFGLTGAAVALTAYSPAGQGRSLVLWALIGSVAWTLLEYLLHRFVLHAVPPFNRWHGEHHLRPAALVSTPTLLSAGLFAVLAALPAWWVLGGWPACAFTFGMLAGYLVYGLMHHAAHHGVPGPLGRSDWLLLHRRRHAFHHAAASSGGAIRPCHYGVSSGLWDYVGATNSSRSSAANGR